MQFPLLNTKRKKGWGEKMIISQIYVSYISMATMCSLAMTQVHPGTLLAASTSNQQPANSAGNLSGTLRVRHGNRRASSELPSQGMLMSLLEGSQA